ncbi:hypothetical protein [Psychrobacter sp. I-STPA10]|uniref:hypothetical protein n=1 Tax=Psychrobacter sp. I-STPA10 TaxID=2585769 RepID=UPI001E4023C5|nr:hypothetical protein [Psychrobacter sp. I-STPA10]
MSEYTFSHQFSQRWLAAPQKVRDAIVHELEDIITLLDSETDLDSFEFRQPDLDAHINKLYAEDEAQKQQEQHQPETAQTDALKQDKHNESTLAIKQQEHIEDTATQLLESQTDTAQPTLTPTTIVSETDNSIQLEDNNEYTGIISITNTNDIDIDNNPKDVCNKDTPTEEIAVKDIDTQQDIPQPETMSEGSSPVTTEALVLELESRIDDYLSEQMAQLSEELKLWLRDEVKRQLDNKE